MMRVKMAGRKLKLSRIVRENISTALVLEDDADWDLHIKGQMRNLALGTNALLQPFADDLSGHADPTYPLGNGATEERDIVVNRPDARMTVPSQVSPYGDGWDVLWLGHCGTRMPHAENELHTHPLGRAVILNDKTVPSLWGAKFGGGGGDELVTKYPAHTRVVHHMVGGVCSSAYAVSQAGARKLLYQFSIKALTDPVDLMLSQYCDSIDRFQDVPPITCLTTSPMMFIGHTPVGKLSSSSEISFDKEDSYVEKANSPHIQYSTRLNFAKLVDGRTDYEQQYPDGENPISQDPNELRVRLDDK